MFDSTITVMGDTDAVSVHAGYMHWRPGRVAAWLIYYSFFLHGCMLAWLAWLHGSCRSLHGCMADILQVLVHRFLQLRLPFLKCMQTPAAH